MRKSVTIAIAIVVVVSVLGTILLWMMQRHFIYFPDETPVPPAASVIADARDVQLTTSDGLELIGWHVPAITNSRNVTVLVAHGNGGNLAGRASLARALADAGFDVLMFDYRGYGGNPGTPSEEGLARDARAAYAYITDSLDVDPQRVLYFGESLGTGVVAELAREHPPAGILLRSPFTSLSDLGKEHYPSVLVSLALSEDYPVIDHIGRLEMPITVVYGTEDDIVPPQHSRDVAEAVAGASETVVVDGAGHNDPVMFGPGPVVTAVEELAGRAIT